MIRSLWQLYTKIYGEVFSRVGSGSEKFHAASCSGGGSKIGSKQEYRSMGSKSSDSKKFVTRSLLFSEKVVLEGKKKEFR